MSIRTIFNASIKLKMIIVVRYTVKFNLAFYPNEIYNRQEKSQDYLWIQVKMNKR